MRARARRGNLVLAAALLAVTAAPASASTRDGNTDHRALVSYQQFVAAQLSNVPAARAASDAFIGSVSTGCPNALAAVALLPATPQRVAVVQAFGEEAGLDLGIAANTPNQAAFAALSNTVSKLRWSDRRAAATVTRFLAATHRLLWLAPTQLCADASVVSLSQAQTMPPTTLQSLATFGQVGTSEQSASSALSRLLAADSGPRDARLLKQLSGLSTRLDRAMTTMLNAEGNKLAVALGLGG